MNSNCSTGIKPKDNFRVTKFGNKLCHKKIVGTWTDPIKNLLSVVYSTVYTRTSEFLLAASSHVTIFNQSQKLRFQPNINYIFIGSGPEVPLAWLSCWQEAPIWFEVLLEGSMMKMRNGCGIVNREIATDTRDLQFELYHRNDLFVKLLCTK